MAITNFLKSNPSSHPIILAGDFNVDEKEIVFNGLKIMGYSPAITNQKTTLKHDCDGNSYLNYAIDNIFFTQNVTKLQGAAIDIVKVCENLENARRLSDHLPVHLRFSLN